MICYYCHWGWPKQVKAIFDDSVAKLGGDDGPLKHGPSHIVWSDENFADDCIRWCLKEATKNRNRYGYSNSEMVVVEKSLRDMLLLPESIRDPEPDDYDGEHPENYPPEIEMVRK